MIVSDDLYRRLAAAVRMELTSAVLRPAKVRLDEGSNMIGGSSR
jgi:hypothetical protein